MRKTFCDRCDHECVNTIVRLNMQEIHQTNQHQVVGEDEYRPMELCRACGDIIIQTLGMDMSKFKLQYLKEDIPMENTENMRAVSAEPTRIPL